MPPRTVVKYSQRLDFRWKASEPSEPSEVPQPLVQTSDLSGTWLPTSTSRGGCMALSVYWIIRNANGEDFWNWLGPPFNACPHRPYGRSDDTPEGESLTVTDAQGMRRTIDLAKAGRVVAEVQELMRLQMAALAKKNSAGPTEKFILVNDKVTEQTNLRRHMHKNVYCAELDGATHFQAGYYYFSIGGDRANGKSFHHGVAAKVVNQENVRFFDPNYGEQEGLFTSMLSRFLEHLAYKKYKLDRDRWAKVEYIHFE